MIDNTILEKKSLVLKTLSDNQNDLLGMLAQVSTDQFLYQPTEESWSIAALVEHIILVEKGVLAGVKKAGTKPADEVITKGLEEEQFRQAMRIRNRKVEAPAQFVPKGIFTNKEAAIEAFNAHRANIADFVKTTDLPLTHIGFPHFVLGILNGFDWFVFMAGHCERHILQMEENMSVGK